MASVIGTNRHEMGLEVGPPEMEKSAVYIENPIYNGKSFRVGQDKNGFKFQLGLYDVNFGADLINFFYGVKRSGEEERLEVLRDVMRSLEGDELKLFEDSLAAVVRSYHSTFGNYAREVGKRIEDFQKNRVTAPYETTMPIAVDSFDQLKYVCERLSRIKDKELRSRIDVSFGDFIFGDPEENAENAQKIMKMIDTIERYGPKELREKLGKSISLMEDRRVDVSDLPKKYQEFQKFVSTYKPDRWGKSALESKLSSPLEEQKFEDEIGKHSFYELFEREGVIISPRGEVYLEKPSLDSKYTKEIDDGGVMTTVAVAMNMDGVVYDKAVALKAIGKMKGALNSVEFRD